MTQATIVSALAKLNLDEAFAEGFAISKQGSLFLSSVSRYLNADPDLGAPELVIVRLAQHNHSN
jgi:hypothetical protein